MQHLHCTTTASQTVECCSKFDTGHRRTIPSTMQIRICRFFLQHDTVHQFGLFDNIFAAYEFHFDRSELAPFSFSGACNMDPVLRITYESMVSKYSRTNRVVLVERGSWPSWSIPSSLTAFKTSNIPWRMEKVANSHHRSTTTKSHDVTAPPPSVLWSGSPKSHFNTWDTPDTCAS